MKKLTEEIINFFSNQNFVIVSTIGRDRMPHEACKGLVKIEPEGFVYLLDLYQGKTFDNLKYNPQMSITAVDEHKFKGYCLKGRGKIIKEDEFSPEIIKTWDEKITGRISQRIIKNLRGEKGHPRHPEALLPKPQYMIVMEVKELVDLTPHRIKAGG
ncbi:MAG: pyridoxamine 5'-phosphate oxidase family protein [Candidatus Omnitrophota bacterium]